MIVRASGERGASETLFADVGVAAAIERRRAMELRPEDASLTDAFRDAASRYLPVDLRDVAVDSGADAAVDALESREVAAAPEYIRPRPKYYHLFEWMRERVEAACPGLPEPVMDKLLAMDADELDLLLKYPRAIRGQAEEFAGVLRDAGAKALETYVTPTMTWEESKALREGRAAGNLADAEKEEEDTDRAALGASGDDGLTREEAAGLPTKISREDGRARTRPRENLRRNSPRAFLRINFGTRERRRWTRENAARRRPPRGERERSSRRRWTTWTEPEAETGREATGTVSLGYGKHVLNRKYATSSVLTPDCTERDAYPVLIPVLLVPIRIPALPLLLRVLTPEKPRALGERDDAVQRVATRAFRHGHGRRRPRRGVDVRVGTLDGNSRGRGSFPRRARRRTRRARRVRRPRRVVVFRVFRASSSISSGA